METTETIDSSIQKDDTEQGSQHYVAHLCSVCQTCCAASVGAQVQIGDINAIQGRLPCKMCRVIATAIESYCANRTHTTHGLHRESFLVVPQWEEQAQHDMSGCDDAACLCHGSFRIDSHFSKYSRPVAVIRHVHAHTYAGLSASYNHEDDTGMLDVALVRSWLKACEEGAGHERCNLPLFLHEKHDKSQKLLVIDVDRMCLAEVAVPLRYFALSYVWGDPTKMFTTVRANVASLTQPGALKEFGDQIPLLIRDVLLLMQKLGERYLWIDSLCTVQDDDNIKSELIGRMDHIYAEAACTIVAHGSLDASSAVPGVREHTRQLLHVVETTTENTDSNSDSLLICASPCHYASNPSAYDTRGWTFQELLLSRRRLVLGVDQMFFSCQCGDICEDPLTNMRDNSLVLTTRWPDAKGKTIGIQNHLNPDLTDTDDTWRTQQAILSLGQLSLRKDMLATIVYLYTSVVTQYSKRKLSYPSDILNAFSGILSFMERSCGFSPQLSVYGLLAVPPYLRSSLHWIAKYPVRRPGWPSWSWTGWNTEIYFLERSNPERLNLQIQRVYLIDQDQVRPLPVMKSDTDADESSSEDTHMHVLLNRVILPLSRQHHPVLAFWAQVAPPKALCIRFHPIRRDTVRIWVSLEQLGENICGHVHETFPDGYAMWPTADPETTEAEKTIHRLSDEEWDRCRLVYLSHSPRPCVYHVYSDDECFGSCNSLIVLPREENSRELEGVLLGERIGMAEVCGNTWRDVAKTREFVALL